MENEECKAVMKYNPLHRSARLSCGHLRRLFYIESTGSITGKYIFKNEYGMEIGNMTHDKWFGKDGSVTVESTKYAYTIQHIPKVELTVFNGTSQQQLLSCGFTTDNNPASGSLASSPTADIHINCLLLGLCWYLLIGVAKDNVVEHAA